MRRRFIPEMVIVVFSITFLLAVSAEARREIEFNEQFFSVSFENKPLGDVLALIQKEKGIWVISDEDLLEERISYNFENLPLEDGLKRLLNRFNHAMIYDKTGRPTGIYLVGKGTTAGTVGDRPATHRNLGSFAKTNYRVAAGKAENTRSSSPPGGLDKESTASLRQAMFDGEKNVEPPGGRPESLTPEQEKLFTIQKNVGPPGGGGQPEASQKNVGPPGGGGQPDTSQKKVKTSESDKKPAEVSGKKQTAPRPESLPMQQNPVEF